MKFSGKNKYIDKYIILQDCNGGRKITLNSCMKLKVKK
jgi:hypothetical protein